METKRCYMCKEYKPIDQFHRQKSAKDGHQNRCKPCNTKLAKGYNYRYEQERRKRDPEFNQKWLEYKRKKDVEWREKNPEKNKEHYRKTAQQRSADPELRAKYTKYERERRQERQRNDPAFHEHLMDMAKRGWHKRRARLAGNGGSYTRSEWRKLCEYYDHRCVCCNHQFQRLTVDHVLPLTKGGTNDIQNIQPLCRSCNSRKHDKEADYRPSLPPWF